MHGDHGVLQELPGVHVDGAEMKRIVLPRAIDVDGVPGVSKEVLGVVQAKLFFFFFWR